MELQSHPDGTEFVKSPFTNFHINVQIFFKKEKQILHLFLTTISNQVTLFSHGFEMDLAHLKLIQRLRHMPNVPF